MKESLLTESEINELIVNYLTNSINEIDLIKLTLWINLSKDNRQYFNSLKDAWIVSCLNANKMQNEKSWNNFKNILKIAPKKIRFKSFGSYLKTAAMWIILMSIGSAITYYLSGKKDTFSAKPVSIYVPLGAKSNITLPDGSNVWLNAGTTLAYDKDYGKRERILQLTGEAFFDVAKDEVHPFIVNAEGIVVKALGTKFNVKAYPEENTVSAILEEGKIDLKLSNNAGELQSLILKPKEKVVFTKEVEIKKELNENIQSRPSIIQERDVKVYTKITTATISSNIQTNLYTSWKEPRWVISALPLGTLTPILERKFNLNIVYSDNELMDYKFSGIIENETVEQILNALKLTAPLEFTIDKDTVRLFVDNKLKRNFEKILKNTNL
jgi:transmembrane sensor